MRKVKVYKCPICTRSFKSFEGWENHIRTEHPESVPKNMTMKQYFYYILTGKTAGVCMVCKKPTPWNESTGRYDRFCTNPKCKDKYREIFKKRMINKYGKVMLLDDPNVQRKMLANRKISGVYTFEDGTKVSYVGSYEKDFLNMLDTFMHVHGSDIMGPSPHTYRYDYKNNKDKEHEGEKFYIPDFFIPSLNLEIEIKDTTTTHHKFIDVDQVKEAQKDEVMKNIKGIRYFKVTNKNYADFFDYILSLKEEEPKRDIEKVKEIVYDRAIEAFVKYRNNFSNKKLFDFNQLIRIPLSTENIYKYKGKCKYLRHMRTTDEYKGIIFLYNNDVVAAINVNTITKTIQGLEISSSYQGQGLSKKILKYAIDKLGADNLSVNKSNLVAIEIYKSFGFKVYRENKIMLFMKLSKSKIDLEPANEALFLSSEDIYINYEEWGKSSECNMLFITGFSGSGKSTLGSNIAREHDAVYCNIDYFHSGKPDLSDPFIKDIFDRCPEYKEYCKEVIEGTTPPYTSESFKILSKIIAAMIESAENHYPNKKYVIEGFQLYSYCPAEYILGKPLIVKGTSALKSLLQRLKRDKEHILYMNPLTTYLQIMRYYKWYVSDNKKIKALVQVMKNKQFGNR